MHGRVNVESECVIRTIDRLNRLSLRNVCGLFAMLYRSKRGVFLF